MRTSLLFALFLFFVSCTFGAEPSVPNPGFEIGNGTTAAQWSWWSRAKTGAAERTTMEPHGGRYAMHIRHEARGDWAFSSTGRVAVRPGQGFRATGWVKVKTGEVALGIVALSKGQTLDWDLGSQGESGAGKSEAGRWVQLQSIAEIPEGCDQIYLRFTGLGVADLVLDDVSLVPADLPKLSPALSPPRPKVEGYARRRVQERLDRGLVAVRTGPGKVHLQWRLLQTDPPATAFNVYRRNGKLLVKVNDRPVSRTTDFIDSKPPAIGQWTYFVRPVIGDREGQSSEEAQTVSARDGVGCHSIRLQGNYLAQKVGIGDLDGDGRLDFVIKQPEGNIDPYEEYWTRSPETYKLEAYRHDGRFLWRFDLGWSIERGIWYSPYLVYDLDGDGKAEVAVKTGEGDPAGRMAGFGPGRST